MLKKGETMDKVKLTVNQLLGIEMTLNNAIGRGNIPTNHAIDRNLSRVKEALAHFRKAQKEEPMCWHFWEQLHPPKPESDTDTGPTEEQRKEGADALAEHLALEITVEPYRLIVSRCSDRLSRLSKLRERLSDDELEVLNENFSVVLRDMDILTDEV